MTKTNFNEVSLKSDEDIQLKSYEQPDFDLFKQKTTFPRSQIIIPLITIALGIICGIVVSRLYLQSVSNGDEQSLAFFNQSENSNVTVFFITCCHRHSHLHQSVTSFIKNSNPFPIKNLYIVQDGPFDQELVGIVSRFPQARLVTTGQHVGQVASMDLVLQHFVDTEYFFYSEDDWELVQPHVIEYDMRILERDPQVIQVCNRYHPEAKVDPVTKIIDQEWQWAGYNMNPTLNRMSDYRLAEGGYAAITGNLSYGLGAGYSEQIINQFYKKKGFYTVQNEFECFKHLGDADGGTKQEMAQIFQYKFNNDAEKILQKDNAHQLLREKDEQDPNQHV